jgi:LPS-assembly protein
MRVLLLLILLLGPGWAYAQGQATLVADQVVVTPDQRLVAAGHVEVFFDGTRLQASAITYDQSADLLTIDGPILIVAADGTIFTADQASMDPRLENGILRGARLVLDQQLQLAATQISRVDGRYSQLTQVAATSCHVCNGRPPLWEIRASAVVHDQAEQQLYFDNASLRIGGVPVLWLPRMRLPDPSLRRATGLLIPRIRSTGLLGLGVKLPYFIRLGDNRDLTLTPYLSARTRTIEARYRQAFEAGSLTIAGAFSRDSILPGQDRGYLFADGQFALGRGFTFGFGAEISSDQAYLLDYGTSSKDRLESGLSLLRVRADDLFVASLTSYESLRDDDINDTLPPFVASLSYERRSVPVGIGGTLTLTGGIESFLRYDTTPGEAGRDVSRFGLGAGWIRDWILPGGVVAGLQGGVDLDYYQIANDPVYAATVLRASPALAVTLRWPLQRQSARGVTTIIEPMFALGWSRTSGGAVPNEDSTLVEFDEANLMALTRFPGQDGRETGLRGSFGLIWTRIDPAGWSTSLTFGRIMRDTVVDGLSAASGLDGVTSDWLLAGQLHLDGGFALTARTLFDDNLEFAKTDARLNWANDHISLNAAYVWLPADADENRIAPISEWTIDSSFRINDQWTLSADGRYDVVADQPSRAGFGISWRNECVTVDLSVSRRYTENTTVDPSTDFGLSVNLNGFSAGRAATRTVATCPS